MLHYYADRFRTVEINSTFRRMPQVSTLEAWAGEVPADFRFVLKAPQRITHIKRLKDVEEPLAQFVEGARTLKRRLGPLLFQLPPNFKKDTPRLAEFLRLLPARQRVAFEFRHASWFDDDVLDLLRKRRVALCLAEADDELEVPFVGTADWGYLRLRRAEYADAELKTWLKQVRAHGWRDAFVFFKHEDEGNGPRFAARLLQLASRSA